MSKVVNLGGKPFDNSINEEVINLLEQHLDMARKGEIRAVGIIMVDKDRRLFTASRNRDAKHELIAGCLYLQHDICAAQ